VSHAKARPIPTSSSLPCRLCANGVIVILVIGVTPSKDALTTETACHAKPTRTTLWFSHRQSAHHASRLRRLPQHQLKNSNVNAMLDFSSTMMWITSCLFALRALLAQPAIPWTLECVRAVAVYTSQTKLHRPPARNASTTQSLMQPSTWVGRGVYVMQVSHPCSIPI